MAAPLPFAPFGHPVTTGNFTTIGLPGLYECQSSLSISDKDLLLQVLRPPRCWHPHQGVTVWHCRRQNLILKLNPNRQNHLNDPGDVQVGLHRLGLKMNLILKKIVTVIQKIVQRLFQKRTWIEKTQSQGPGDSDLQSLSH